MKLLVLSAGSIGRRHIRNIRRLYPQCELGLLRHTASPLASEILKHIDVFHDNHTTATAWRPDGVIICSPASVHCSDALPFAKRGVPIMMEKPMANTSDAAANLLDVCARHGAPLLIAYPFRFDASYNSFCQTLSDGRIGDIQSIRVECGSYLPDWRPDIDYRFTVSAQRKLGGGALLELSHELDYLLHGFGPVEVITAYVQRLGDLKIDVEDTVDATFRLRAGAEVALHLSFIQSQPSRSCTVRGSRGTVIWDLLKRSVHLDVDDESEVREFIEPSAMYDAELKAFVDMIGGANNRGCDGDHALRVLHLIDAIREAAATGERTAQ